MYRMEQSQVSGNSGAAAKNKNKKNNKKNKSKSREQVSNASDNVASDNFLHACAAGDHRLVGSLLNQRGDPNTTNRSGLSALGIACQLGQLDMAELLMDNKVPHFPCQALSTDRTYT